MPNEEQTEYWSGKGGEHWVAEAERYDAMIREFGKALLAAADPQPGERALELGCGNGALAVATAERLGPDGRLTAVDVSAPMLDLARSRADAAGLTNVEFVEADVQTYPFEPDGYDFAFSRFAVMFFDDPDAAFGNVAVAVRPGGRVAFTCWQELFANQWVMIPAAAALEYVPMPDLGEPGGPGPFSLAEPDRVRSLLEGAGFTDPSVEALEAPVRVGADVEDAVAYYRMSDFAETLFADVDDDTAAKAWEAVSGAIAPYATPEGVTLPGGAWLVTATRA